MQENAIRSVMFDCYKKIENNYRCHSHLNRDILLFSTDCQIQEFLPGSLLWTYLIRSRHRYEEKLDTTTAWANITLCKQSIDLQIYGWVWV